MASDQDKRKLTDLRVVDLRSELEKRGIDKMGVKAVLIERLIKVLEEEGHDPEVYTFEPLSKIPQKRISNTKARSDPDTESESQSNADDTHDLSLDVDDEIREDLAAKSEEAKIVKSPTVIVKPTEEPSSKDVSETTNGNGEKDNKDDAETVGEKPDTSVSDTKVVDSSSAVKIKQEFVESEVPKVKVIKEGEVKEPKIVEKVVTSVIKNEVLSPMKAVPEVDKTIPDTNGLDNEDSINLDIGEDEEKLLADEEDSCSHEKENKDEGDRASKSQDTAEENKNEGTKIDERKQTTSGDDKGKTQEELKDDKAKSGISDQKSKDDKDKGKKSTVSSSSSSSRNLWVSGLSSATRATDLKQVFSKYGKVFGAKVVTNARTPGARCYGYVTMATSEEASKCIQYLHRTELHGRMISVERAKGDSGPPRKGDNKTSILDKKRHERKPSNKPEEKKKEADDLKKDSPKSDTSAKVEKTTEKKFEESVKADVKVDVPKETAGDKVKEDVDKDAATDADKEKEKRLREIKKRRIVIGKGRSPHRGRPVGKGALPPRKRPIASLLTFAQIRDERERNKLRERERELRQEERRGRDLIARQREIERRQRDEYARLDREKEKLRLERERIEIERAELLRLERERQRLERERLDREREELKRQQLRLKAQAVPRMHIPTMDPPLRFEDNRRATKRPAEDRREIYPDDRKRVTTERRFEQPTPRFEVPNARSNDFPAKKEVRRTNEFAPQRRNDPAKFERNAFVAQESRPSRREATHEIPRREHTREHAVAPTVTRVKDNRFDRAAPNFRVREERRPEVDHRSKVDPRQSSRDRYADSAKGNFGSSSKGEGRYTDRTGSTWHAGGGPAPTKAFSGSLGSAIMAPRDTWGGTSSDRKSDGQGWSRPLESGWTSSSEPMMSRSGPSLSSSMYSGSSQNLPPSMSNLGMTSGGGPFTSERFVSYKQSLGPIRKY